MTDDPLRGKTRIEAHALLLGQRIDLRDLEPFERLDSNPLTVRAGESGLAVLLRYGALVLFDLSPLEKVSIVSHVKPLVQDRLAEPESENVTIVIDPGREERVTEDGTLIMHRPSLARLQIVADVLAKSAVLAHYEGGIAEAFDRIEPLATRLRLTGRSGSQAKALLRQLGEVFLMQQQMVGRVELIDRPEILWERPELERLYDRLQDEFELPERHRIVDRKLELITRMAETSLGLVQDRRSLRVEWYIVILILVEILLYLYEIFLR